MRIASFGSCLSNMVVNRLISRFGGNKAFHIARNRSDQFYHYYINHDIKKIPLEYINKLAINKPEVSDPNFIPHDLIIQNQYKDIELNSKFDLDIKNGNFDILVIDNYVDMGIKLSYPAYLSEEFKNSSILLKNNDYYNYDELFTLGDLITNENSCFYFEKIIDFFRQKNPNAIIYFLHYPYNTYKQNAKRIKRAKEFESMFDSDNCIIVPAVTISDKYQIANDPAHFEDSIYVAYCGFIYNHFRVIQNESIKKTIKAFYKNSRFFNNHNEFFPIEPFTKCKSDSWSAVIELLEVPNNQPFNFFFGERGTSCLSLVRRQGFIEFRADDNHYVSGISFDVGKINQIAVTYSSGTFVFYNNGNKTHDIYHPTSACFNAIGSGYDGTQHEQPTYISRAAIFDYCLTAFEVNDYFLGKTLDNSKSWAFKSNEEAVRAVNQ